MRHNSDVVASFRTTCTPSFRGVLQYSLSIKDGKLNYDYNCFGQNVYYVESKDKLPSGDIEVARYFDQQPFKPLVDPADLPFTNNSVGKGEIAKVASVRFSATETLDIGTDLGSTVSPAYRKHASFAFTGTIHKVVVEVAADQPIKK